jgi:hypothetical protein
MAKVLVVFVIACMICFSMSGAAVSLISPSKINKENILYVEPETKKIVTPNAMASLKDIVDKYLNLDEKPDEYYKESESQSLPKPLLGGDEVFGLWIHIIYKDRYGNVKYDGLEKIDGITPRLIRGKLSNPNYRTPIKFDVDDDSDDDIEIGFGFFRGSIDEIQEDGSKFNHKAWTSAFDFKQIKSYLDDQLGELEVWQEFHINLNLVKNSASNSMSSNSVKLSKLMSLYQSTKSPHMKSILERAMDIVSRDENTVSDPLSNPLGDNPDGSNNEFAMGEPVWGGTMLPAGASEDYLVFRVGYRSPVGEKIPVNFKKEFSVARTEDSIFSIFKPRIFQHLMDPNDIIGTASNDVLFGFQAYRQGMSDPAYDIDFCVNFKPAVYLVTQFTPRWGKTFYYYHDCGSVEALDVTFSSEARKGGDEEEGSLSLTLSLDPVGTVTGVGKWMCFDLDWGKFIYTASHKFNVAIVVSSPRFEEKIQVKGIPTRAELSLDVDVDFVYVQDERLELDVTGSIGLDMSSKLDDIIIYYPKFDPNVTSDATFLKVSNIPSSNTFTAYGGFKILNSSMLEVQAESYVELDMSSQPGGIFLYYPKLITGVEDMVLVKVDGIPSREKAGIKFILRVDPDLDNFFVNSDNYFFGRAYRDFSSNFGSMGLYLPNVTTPVLEVTEIPAHAEVKGEIYWNRLEGFAKAQRWSSGGPDPIAFNIEFDAIAISDVLEIRDGFIRFDFKIAEEGYFGFDSNNEMIGNQLNISNTGTGNSIGLDVGTVSADDLWVDWTLDTSGEEVKIDDLYIGGTLESFKNFYVSVDFEWENFNFDGSWSLGDSGGFEIDLYQEEDVKIHFLNIDDLNGRIDLDGYAVLDNDLHFDVSWEWGHSGHFYINNNTNEPNLKELNFKIIYEDESDEDWYGVNITLYNFGIWVIIDWIGIYWTSDIYVSGQLDLDLLLNYKWYPIWP